MTGPARDHGGGIDAAADRWGGTRADWIDLSTGINPVPYPLDTLEPQAWTALPDRAATDRLIAAARTFWQVPQGARIVPAPGASALIARMPDLAPPGAVRIPTPTYNEHAAAFRAAGREVGDDAAAPACVLVHPNNPDGRLWPVPGDAALTVIDESFCDTDPAASHVARTQRPGTIVLKSFGKFWGLAGLRLGVAIGHPDTLAPAGGRSLDDLLGPWPVSGPALQIGARALEDGVWAEEARARLVRNAARLDALLTGAGARVAGGTPLFRLYKVDDAGAWQERLAAARIWSRTFPYSRTWLRLGLPGPEAWDRVAQALR
ncbi:threonine-phosphate decarboxylase [Wenxinia marina]|uniref:Aminotransferase n=1 Tax=Wenxinia marina DSM 24838 TaxID=1123501 RepID=A0A0D0Q6H2_9RHOB|nr:threonine-phosphate decarboxylase [Wenxinia marina]KIQ68057.1 L-threonine O-3-phosphate decarboxylase [Wenxinia marina DSM 24838]GGL75064.1 threonine-phosphate decarboxylase [Wenxinia marina]